MPELPEVETVRRGLSELIGDQPKIEKIEVFQRQLRWPIPRGFSSRLKNKTLKQISRRGKYMLWHFGDEIMLNHLGMTGSWREPDTGEKLKHDHVRLTFSSGKVLCYHDPRRFGSIDLAKENKITEHPRLKSLGVEPLEANRFTSDYLFKVCKQRSVSIKSVIMDQKVVVGVGNIYASEALFFAGIRPTKSAKQLSRPKLQLLVEAIQKVLQESIDFGGSTISDYRQANGSIGSFQERFAVYDREGASCRTCGNEIKAKVISGRSTYFCPTCQS
jgi:formamidopyrimidine-DNA glycosylase